MAYQGTFGVHFPIHQPGWLEMSASRIVDLAAHAAEEVALGDFPVLAGYFQIKPEARLKLQFRPGTPVSFWMPPKGPKMLDVAARVCDGVIFNTYTQYAALPHLRSGKLEKTVRD